MKPLLLIASALAFAGSTLLMRIVIHGYTDHGHLDVLHLLVAIGAASVGALVLFRAFRGRAARRAP